MTKIAFVYPGQGTQFVGMGKELYENNEKAKKLFDEIFNSLDIDLKKVMFEGSEEELKSTEYTQVAIVSFSLVLTELLKEKGIVPNFVAGHSVGEYAAFGASEMLSFKDACLLAAKRGAIMKEVANKNKGTMAAILGLESAKIIELLKDVDGIVEAVNFNEPNQTVIAGDFEAVEKACAYLKENGAKRAIILAVSGPFHSVLMKEAGELLKEEVKDKNFKITDIKLIANTDAEILENEAEVKEEIYRQAFGPVKWVDTINKMSELGVETVYEVGPGSVLAGLMRKINRDIKVVSVNSLESLKNIL